MVVVWESGCSNRGDSRSEGGVVEKACKIVPMVDQLQSVSVSVSGGVSVSGSVHEHHWVTGVDGERKRKMKFFRCSKNSFRKILKKSR